MIGRVRTRQEFAQLARSGNRTAATFLWCNWCLDPTSSQMKVAFAITRSYGSAVKRNRLRRQIRAALNAADNCRPLPPATVLIGVRRPRESNHHHRTTAAREQTFAPTYTQIDRDLATLLTSIRRSADATAEDRVLKN